MSFAWTTVFIIALLMPGIAFFIGYWARERYSREIVKSTAVGEVGMAIFIATVIHLFGWWVLWKTAGFDPSFYYRPLAEFENAPHWLVLDQFFARLWPSLLYLISTSIVGFGLGYLIALMVMFGWLRGLATHAWAYDLIKEVKKRGTVTAYVLTTTVENNRAMMYTGHLEEFYLDANGWFAYIVLKDCQRFFMKFDGDCPTTGPREALFRIREPSARKWEHLVIDGKNISNILFDPSIGDIAPTSTGATALDEALRAFQQELLDQATKQGPTIR